MSLVSTVLLAQTLTLVIASLFIVYPVVAYSRNVAHTWGLLLLSASLFVTTGTYVATFVLDMTFVSNVLDAVAALLAGAGVWQFARPFVRFETAELDAPAVDEASGGFESAGDD